MPGNAVTKLATITPSGTTVATFSSISSAYDDLYIIASVKTDSTTSTQNRNTARLYYRLNSDTGFNYYSVAMYTDGASTIGLDAFSGSGTNNLYLSCAPTSYNSATLGWGSFDMYFPGYTDATAVSGSAYLGKPHRVRSCYDFASSSTAYGGAQIGNNQWPGSSGTNAAINRIDFTTIYGNYKAGTTFTMYGIKNT